MKVLVLSGSLRPKGNTEALIGPFVEELESGGASVRCIRLAERNIESCDGCKVCQNFLDEYGCCKEDDMHQVVDGLLWCDGFVLATPIYSWYCTAPMKAMLDRHYGLNKYYGAKRGTSLWEGKKCWILTTCGYDIEYGAGPFEEGIRRLCKHSKLKYIGKLGIQDRGNPEVFYSDEAIDRVRGFARKIGRQLVENR
ncbi:MAG: flavodoxin family protein [Anaerovoracaceae bacterium]|jgi:multimeric flavodoxin WrbA